MGIPGYQSHTAKRILLSVMLSLPPPLFLQLFPPTFHFPAITSCYTAALGTVRPHPLPIWVAVTAGPSAHRLRVFLNGFFPPFLGFFLQPQSAIIVRKQTSRCPERGFGAAQDQTCYDWDHEACWSFLNTKSRILCSWEVGVCCVCVCPRSRNERGKWEDEWDRLTGLAQTLPRSHHCSRPDVVL